MAILVRIDTMPVGQSFRFLLSAILVLICLHTGLTQRVIVNGNGERLIMYPDGSWRLAEAGDSVLLRQNLQKSETITYPSDQVDDRTRRNPGEEEEYTLRQWNELYFKIKEQEKKAQNQFRFATNAQFKAGELLQTAEANKKMIESDKLATLHDNYEKTIENLRAAKLRQKAIVKLMDESKKVATKNPKTIKRKLQPLTHQFQNYLTTYDPNYNIQDLSKSSSVKKEIIPVPSTYKSQPSPVTKNADVSAKSMDQHTSSGKKKDADKNKNPKPTVTKTERLSSARTVSIRIPPGQIAGTYKSESFPCKLATDTIDSTTGTHRVALAPGLIFTDTDPDLRPYFKSKELITCYGRLSKISAYIYFTIDFQIASSHSQGNFGSLETGSLLRLRLLNGKYVSLYNLKSDRGRIDPYSGNTIFTGQYSLGKDELKMLSSSPLDKIRILWGTGYEDYDVYKIDFFIDQISCLLSK